MTAPEKWSHLLYVNVWDMDQTKKSNVCLPGRFLSFEEVSNEVIDGWGRVLIGWGHVSVGPLSLDLFCAASGSKARQKVVTPVSWNDLASLQQDDWRKWRRVVCVWPESLLVAMLSSVSAWVSHSSFLPQSRAGHINVKL